jgi:hypothetical protein
MVWIDALCINQTDLKERSNQVTLMTEVYKRAVKVLVCLDNDLCEDKGTDTDWAFAVWLTIVKIARFCEIDGWNIAEALSPFYKRTPFPTHLKPEDRASIERLFSCHWFQRIWVVQEVTVAREVVVVVGNQELDWHFLGQAAARILGEMNMNDTAVRGLDQAYKMWLLRSARLQGIVLLLQELMDRFVLARATDPKDLIYALLGISKQQDNTSPTGNGKSKLLPPVPNYEDSLLDIYCDWTRYFIEDSQSIDLFSHTAMYGIGKPEDVSERVPYR